MESISTSDARLRDKLLLTSEVRSTQPCNVQVPLRQPQFLYSSCGPKERFDATLVLSSERDLEDRNRMALSASSDEEIQRHWIVQPHDLPKLPLSEGRPGATDEGGREEVVTTRTRLLTG